MPSEASPPAPARGLLARGQAYWPDQLAALILFVTASIAAGRVWRFPFDDEVFTLGMAESGRSPSGVLSFYLTGGEVHPPLADFMFYTLHRLGLNEAQMRLCSLAMTAVSLTLMHRLTLAVIGQRTHTPLPSSTRLLAMLLFGLAPLAIGVGDAIRWYPLFTLLFSLFFTLYLGAGNPLTRLGSAVALGLAASTNFLALLVGAALLLYRYVLERQFRPLFDAAYWLLVLLFGSLGLVSGYSVVAKRMHSIIAYQVGYNPFRALLTDGLGFFGGEAVGVSQAWIVLPVALVILWALFREIDRRNPANPVHFFLLMFVATAPMVLVGFVKPRSFLYLAPVAAAMLTFLLDRWGRERGAAATALLAAFVLAAPVAALANLNGGSSAFKRNTAVPYDEIIDFIDLNQRGSVLVVSSDNVLVWLLEHRDQGPGDHCISYFAHATCFAEDRSYDSVLVISGHSNRSGAARFMDRFDAALAAKLAGRQQVATFHAGRDNDAGIKSRLTNTPLEPFLLLVALYR